MRRHNHLWFMNDERPRTIEEHWNEEIGKQISFFREYRLLKPASSDNSFFLVLMDRRCSACVDVFTAHRGRFGASSRVQRWLRRNLLVVEFETHWRWNRSQVDHSLMNRDCSSRSLVLHCIRVGILIRVRHLHILRTNQARLSSSTGDAPSAPLKKILR